MLKLQLKNDSKGHLQEFEYEDLRVSKDLDFLTCICSGDENIQDGDEIVMHSLLYDEKKTVNVSVEEIYALGEFTAETYYSVSSDTFSNCKYIQFSDNKFYYSKAWSEDDEIVINEIAYPILNADGSHSMPYIAVPQKYLIDGDEIMLHDGRIVHSFIERKMNEDNDYVVTNSQISWYNKDNEEYEDIASYDLGNIIVYNHPKKLLKLTIPIDEGILLNIESISCVSLNKYVVYQGIPYYLNTSGDAYSSEYVYINDTLSGIATPIKYEYDIETDKHTISEDEYSSFSSVMDTTISSISRMVVINDADRTKLDILYRFVESSLGYQVNVYLKDFNVPMNKNYNIVAKTVNHTPRYQLLDSRIDENGDEIEFFYYNGKLYNKQSGDTDGNPYYYVLIGDEEHEFKFLKDSEGNTSNSGYIEHEDSIMLFNIGTLNDAINEYQSQFSSGGEIIINDVDISTTSSYTYNEEHVQINCNEDEYSKVYNVKTYVSGNTALIAYMPSNMVEMINHIDEDGNAHTVFVSNPIYGIRRYDIIEINGQKYKVYQNSNTVDTEDNDSRNYMLFDQPEYVRLNITSIEGSNRFLCEPILDDPVFDDNESLEYEVKSTICHSLMVNTFEYDYYLENRFSAHDEVLDFRNYSTYDSGHTLSLYQLALYKKIDYYDLPLFSNQEVANNMFQEDLLNNIFVPVEENNAINSIVDMDKDVYYPYFIWKKEKREVQSISFDLHFRTRTLSTWKINEDYTKLNVSSSADTLFHPTFNEANTNWFCFDMYSGMTANGELSDNGSTLRQSNGNYDIKKNVQESWKHSDLLYFLGFNENDVFFQKNKLSKSFLRLTFYDTKYPDNQSLLYQATVWFDAHKVYKKYIDNIEQNQYFNFASNTVTKGIRTGGEPFDIMKRSTDSGFTFDDDIRLDCKFIINNRYLTKESAEGFYLYLFKDLADGICKRTIYMKVQFNHAGTGEKCLFTLPRGTNGKKWTYTDDNIKKLISGVSLNDVLDEIYIPLTLEYDKELNRFIYYLPTDLASVDTDNNELNFNLFEIKIKDESN